jgi:hypothetical protein
MGITKLLYRLFRRERPPTFTDSDCELALARLEQELLDYRLIRSFGH